MITITFLYWLKTRLYNDRLYVMRMNTVCFKKKRSSTEACNYTIWIRNKHIYKSQMMKWWYIFVFEVFSWYFTLNSQWWRDGLFLFFIFEVFCYLALRLPDSLRFQDLCKYTLFWYSGHYCLNWFFIFWNFC